MDFPWISHGFPITRGYSHPRDDAAAFPTPQSSTTMSPIDRAASLDAEEVNEAQQSRSESLTFVWSPNEVGAVNLICVYIYIHIHICIYMYTHTPIYIYTFTCDLTVIL